MSYLQKRYGSRGVGALGGLEEILTTAMKGAATALDVAGDPYLPEVLCRVAQLKQIEATGATPTACTSTASGLPGGIGLRNAVTPLRAYVYAQQHKWVYPIALLAVVGIPMWIGYELGRGGH
jgi:hypothetical protein